MGTHPIFESDFDCLTDKRRFRIMSDTEAPAAPVPVAAPGSFTVETAVQDVLKQGAIQDGLSRGLNEAVRALERRDALICLLAENCDEANYVRLIEALPRTSNPHAQNRRQQDSGRVGWIVQNRPRKTPERWSAARASSFDRSRTARRGISSKLSSRTSE